VEGFGSLKIGAIGTVLKVTSGVKFDPEFIKKNKGMDIGRRNDSIF